MKTHTKDYYLILGVSEQASEVEIKKTYRKLALEHHPDRNPNDPKSEERFKDITEAYGVLMDPAKRKEYDLFRKNPFGGAQGGPQFRYSQQEIFENMFRQAFGKDIFNDLNTDFKQSGFRGGPDFFGAVFFWYCRWTRQVPTNDSRSHRKNWNRFMAAKHCGYFPVCSQEKKAGSSRTS